MKRCARKIKCFNNIDLKVLVGQSSVFSAGGCKKSFMGFRAGSHLGLDEPGMSCCSSYAVTQETSGLLCSASGGVDECPRTGAGRDPGSVEGGSQRPRLHCWHAVVEGRPRQEPCRLTRDTHVGDVTAGIAGGQSDQGIGSPPGARSLRTRSSPEGHACGGRTRAVLCPCPGSPGDHGDASRSQAEKVARRASEAEEIQAIDRGRPCRQEKPQIVLLNSGGNNLRSTSGLMSPGHLGEDDQVWGAPGCSWWPPPPLKWPGRNRVEIGDGEIFRFPGGGESQQMDSADASEPAYPNAGATQVLLLGFGDPADIITRKTRDRNQRLVADSVSLALIWRSV